MCFEDLGFSKPSALVSEIENYDMVSEIENYDIAMKDMVLCLYVVYLPS